MESHMGLPGQQLEEGDVPEVYYSPYETPQQKTSYNRRLYQLINEHDLASVIAQMRSRWLRRPMTNRSSTSASGGVPFGRI